MTCKKMGVFAILLSNPPTDTTLTHIECIQAAIPCVLRVDLLEDRSEVSV